ncbi:MAG TPA: UDP-3-O-(3-hydroxymyristoyl)glucosamine N-acyltransferase [Bryobacteraceae bacterium]|jgi:UDP-3-O-[3-hydroxymyristoyl] glucosamine N-acyltransferase|nr:UDP-3-O-(3-hydroxymyristoyl)glucosamine N-acyltransferase [Bryobacteraceae bacterium]
MAINAKYDAMPSLTTSRIAVICGGELGGDPERVISGANTLDAATPSDLAFVANAKAAAAAGSSQAGCLIVGKDFVVAGRWTLVRVSEPRLAFARALTALYQSPEPKLGIDSTAIVAADAQIETSCTIGARVTIGERTVIAAKCRIGDGCVIGNDVDIAEETVLHPNVTVYHRVRIGARVILHAGCVIGADGFGFTLIGDHYEKFPQVGSVSIEDDVEIGANCCVDRAALGVTRIGRGTKLDNLVHVAHNCDIGSHVVVAAQTGFSGSVRVGDYAVIGGQAGIGEKAKIEPRAIVGGKAGVLTGQTVHAGEPVWGIPARPLKQHLKGLANIGKIPQLREDLARLKKQLREEGKIPF